MHQRLAHDFCSLMCLCPKRFSWTALMINQFEANDPIWIDGKTVLVSAC
jgi:hypothetical protein